MEILKLFSIYLILISACLLSTIDCFAYDGERKGFIIGFGAGLGMSDLKQASTYFGFQTDFKIGYAPRNDIELYITNKISWIGLDASKGEKVIIANGLSAVAGSYFFKEEGPSPFVTGGLGMASWNPLFEEAVEVVRGLGFFVGGGYEFNKHWDVSGNIVCGDPFSQKGDIDSITFQLTINIMGY